MCMLYKRAIVSIVVVLCSLSVGLRARADIFRWDTDEVIPGTEGIELGPGVDLSHKELEYAKLTKGVWMGPSLPQRLDLTGASFAASNLRHASLLLTNLTDADFTGANLTSAMLGAANVTNANLTSCQLANANLRTPNYLGAADLHAATYNQGTQFPDDFDPVAAGLTFAESPAGDFDANDVLDLMDVDWLTTKIRDDSAVYVPLWLPDAMFDLNSDQAIDLEDHRVWVKNLKHTWYGDANLDGEFNTADLVKVLEAGRYQVLGYAGWSQGDWNGDGRFNTADLTKALDDGGYEKGPRGDAAAVPEPTGWLLLLMGLLPGLRRRLAWGAV